MELVNHIRDLLYHHDCVVIPGFGGFVTNERPAITDRTSGSFYPPSKEVGFNIRLDHHDGLLASYLSARLSMNYVDVRKMIDSFVDEVKEKLYSGETVYFDGIGQFMVDRESNLQFDPDPSANFLTDAYGLSFFRYPEIDTGKKGGRLQKSFDDRHSLTSRSRLKKMLRYAAIGIPLIAALGWGAMNTSYIREFGFDLSSLNPFSAVVDSGIKINDHQEVRYEPGDSQVAGSLDEMSSQRRAMMYQETTPELSTETHGIYDEQDLTAGQSGEAGHEHFSSGAEDESNSIAGVAEAPARIHYLIAGSFNRKQNALMHSEKLRSGGYQPEIIESEKGMYRVTLFASQNRGEALQMLRKLRAQEGTSDTWMLSK